MATAGAPRLWPAAARGAAFLALWVVLAGTAPLDLPVGIVAACLATWASLRLMPPSRLHPRPAAVLLLLLRLPWQALRAGIDVALLALDPRRRPQPGTVACAVSATPTTGAGVAMAGCMIEFTCGSPFS